MATAQTSRVLAHLPEPSTNAPTDTPARRPRNGNPRQLRRNRLQMAIDADDGAAREHHIDECVRGLADRLVERCVAAGMSPTRLLDLTGHNKCNLALWRQGHVPNGRSIARLADALGCSSDYLLGLTADPTRKP